MLPFDSAITLRGHCHQSRHVILGSASGSSLQSGFRDLPPPRLVRPRACRHDDTRDAEFSIPATGLRYLDPFDRQWPLRRHDLAAEIFHLKEPHKLPLTMSPKEAERLMG